MVVTALASGLVVGVAYSSAGTDLQTRVRMLDTAPLTLRGVGFDRAERVRLTVSLGERIAVRKVRASEAGTFTEVFRALSYGRCGPPLAVKAVGLRGNRVSWELVPLECPDNADA